MNENDVAVIVDKKRAPPQYQHLDGVRVLAKDTDKVFSEMKGSWFIFALAMLFPVIYTWIIAIINAFSFGDVAVGVELILLFWGTFVGTIILTLSIRGKKIMRYLR